MTSPPAPLTGRRRSFPHPPRRSRWLWLALVDAWFALHPAALLADGAFADSQVILLPRTRPHRIIASSELGGLLISDDDGATWSWICDGAIGFFSALFQLGAPPAENIYAITRAGLATSVDAGCSWQHSADIAKRAGDVFPDPRDPKRVFAVAQVQLTADSPLLGDVVVESNDGGQSFGSTRYMTGSASITGVEIARSDSNMVYLTMSTFELQHPCIAHSNDGGATWTTQDLSRQLERRPYTIRILSVDPSDANTLYIRLSDGVQDSLAITHDRGTTLLVAQRLASRMTAFLLRSDGALIVAAADATSFISTDGGATFAPWSDTFHIQALAEKDGALYASASSQKDGFAVAVSTDAGESWRPLLRLPELRGPLGCSSVRDQCDAAWTQLEPSLEAVSGKLSEAADASEPVDGQTAAPGAADERRAGGHGCSVRTPMRKGGGATCLLSIGAIGGWIARRRTRRFENKENWT